MGWGGVKARPKMAEAESGREWRAQIEGDCGWVRVGARGQSEVLGGGRGRTIQWKELEAETCGVWRSKRSRGKELLGQVI